METRKRQHSLSTWRSMQLYDTLSLPPRTSGRRPPPNPLSRTDVKSCVEGELLVRHVCPEGLVLVDRALVHLVVRRHARAHARQATRSITGYVLSAPELVLAFFWAGSRHGLCRFQWSRER